MRSVNPEIFIPIVFFVSIFGIVVIKILADAFTKIVCHWRDVSLKMQMIEAGFSAVEIEQVVQSVAPRPSHSAKASPPARHVLVK